MSCRRGGAVVPIGRLWRHSKWLSNPGRRYLGLLLKLRMYLNRVKTNIFHEWFLKHVEIKQSVNFWNSFYKKLAENSHLCFKMAWIYDAKKFLILNSLKVLPESRKKFYFLRRSFSQPAANWFVARRRQSVGSKTRTSLCSNIAKQGRTFLLPLERCNTKFTYSSTAVLDNFVSRIIMLLDYLLCYQCQNYDSF